MALRKPMAFIHSAAFEKVVQFELQHEAEGKAVSFSHKRERETKTVFVYIAVCTKKRPRFKG